MKARIGVFVHFHYLEMWSELVYYLKNLPLGFYLIASVTEREPAAMEEAKRAILAFHPESHILPVPNRGKNIGGLIASINYCSQNGLDFEYILHVHTKKSLKAQQNLNLMMHGERDWASYMLMWRLQLLDSILGSRERVEWILSQMSQGVGMVGSSRWLYDISSTSHRVMKHIREYRKRFNLNLDGCNFIAGTMFWQSIVRSPNFFLETN
jgi:lipopolysaccharide biosynthesis protein